VGMSLQRQSAGGIIEVFTLTVVVVLCMGWGSCRQGAIMVRRWVVVVRVIQAGGSKYTVA
jgi:hypothetical protein